MSTPDRSDNWDAIVVGSGLAGLTAALKLQHGGARVLLIERRTVPGGLCGNWESDGWEFPRACADFSGCVARELAALGVRVTFEPARYRLRLGARLLHLPPTPGEALGLLRYAPSAIRLLLAARSAQHRSLASLLDAHASPELSDLMGILAGLSGVPLPYVRMEDLQTLARSGHDYGYTRLAKAVGGPGVIVDGMVSRFRALGGVLRLGVTCRGIRRAEAGYVVDTAGGDLSARQVISTQARVHLYPPESVPGLHYAQFLLAVKREFKFPPGIQTLVHLPAGIAHWMTDLNEGRAPAAFGFQLFRTLTPVREGAYPVASYLLMPRNEHAPTPERVRALEQYFFAQAEALLPGLARAVVYKRFLSPADFARIHDLPSAPLPLMPPPGFTLPSAYDPQTGIYYAGASLAPPNDTAAAVLSGACAAERVKLALAAQR